MLKIKPFRQTAGLCGPACLKMVLSYYNRFEKEQHLADLCGATQDAGVETDAMLVAIKTLGFDGYIKDHSTFDDIRTELKTNQRPVILEWFSDDDGHYTVAVDIDDENIYMIDPEIGHTRAMRLKKFFRIWFDFPGEYIHSKDDLTLRRMMVIYPNDQKQ